MWGMRTYSGFIIHTLPLYPASSSNNWFLRSKKPEGQSKAVSQDSTVQMSPFSWQHRHGSKAWALSLSVIVKRWGGWDLLQYDVIPLLLSIWFAKWHVLIVPCSTVCLNKGIVTQMTVCFSFFLCLSYCSIGIVLASDRSTRERPPEFSCCVNFIILNVCLLKCSIRYLKVLLVCYRRRS